MEPSIESEDQERFEETAKFEEDIDTSKVEPKPERKQARKLKVARKRMKINQYQNYMMI